MLERKHVFPMLRLPRRPTGARVVVVVVVVVAVVGVVRVDAHELRGRGVDDGRPGAGHRGLVDRRLAAEVVVGRRGGRDDRQRRVGRSRGEDDVAVVDEREDVGVAGLERVGQRAGARRGAVVGRDGPAEAADGRLHLREALRALELELHEDGRHCGALGVL